MLYFLVGIFSNAINRLVCLTETTVASGDDEGCIKVLNIALILLLQPAFKCWPVSPMVVIM